MLTFGNKVSSDYHLQNVAPTVTVCSYLGLSEGKKDGGGNVVVDRGACELLLAKLGGDIHFFRLYFIGQTLSHEKPVRHAEKYSAIMCLRKKQRVGFKEQLAETDFTKPEQWTSGMT